jgi:two-component system chemotaxis sensor kinase CheA
VQYRGGSLPLLTLDQVANVGVLPDQASYFVIVFAVNGKEIGLQVSQIVDVLDAGSEFDEVTFRQSGVLGSAILGGATTLLVDLYGVVKAVAPEWCVPLKRANQKVRVLIADDSPFYLRQISQFATEAGFEVIQAHDGKEAFETLERDGHVDALLTDVEMPRMDGLELTRRVRATERWSNLPVIAITSLSGEDAVRKGMEAGVDRYIVKLDRERIIQAIDDVIVAKGR